MWRSGGNKPESVPPKLPAPGSRLRKALRLLLSMAVPFSIAVFVFPILFKPSVARRVELRPHAADGDSARMASLRRQNPAGVGAGGRAVICTFHVDAPFAGARPGPPPFSSMNSTPAISKARPRSFGSRHGCLAVG